MSLMKLTKEKQRELVWDALFRNGGERLKTAKELNVSERTLARYISDLDLHGDMEKLGWKRNAGPPPGMPRGSSIIRMRILAHIKAKKGNVDYGKLATDIYGQDTPAVRHRLYAALESLKQQEIVSFDGDIWKVLTDKLDRAG